MEFGYNFLNDEILIISKNILSKHIQRYIHWMDTLFYSTYRQHIRKSWFVQLSVIAGTIAVNKNFADSIFTVDSIIYVEIEHLSVRILVCWHSSNFNFHRECFSPIFGMQRGISNEFKWNIIIALWLWLAHKALYEIHLLMKYKLWCGDKHFSYLKLVKYRFGRHFLIIIFKL